MQEIIDYVETTGMPYFLTMYIKGKETKLQFVTGEYYNVDTHEIYDCVYMYDYDTGEELGHYIVEDGLD